MINIKNTNLTLKGGEVLMNFTTIKNGFGNRMLVVCSQHNEKKVLSKYKKLGFFFSSATFFDGYNFFRLTKSLKQYTIKGKQVVISNELYHINKHVENGNSINIELN